MQHFATTSKGFFAAQPNRSLFIGLSIILHITFLVLARPLKNDAITPTFDKEIKLVLDSPKLPTPPTAIKQIVSPSDMEETKEVPNSNLLSDKNTKVERQQIKRGDIPNATKNLVIQPPVTKSTLDKNKKVTTAPEKTVEKIINSKDILAGISNSTLKSLNKDQPSKTAKNEAHAEEQKSLAASEARLNSLAGLAGNPDLVTNIPDGEITLLNAKADRFAVFVRRVALQVFSALRTSNWYEAGDISRGFETEEVTARATLDKTGKFLQVELIQSSKATIFDKVLINSIRKGAWDKNPPQQALAPDGTIKFIFKSRAAVRGGPQGRSRQWIMLATGLE